MEAAVREAPQLSQVTMWRRVEESRASFVFALLHISHVTNSLMYFRNRLSACLGWYRPLKISWPSGVMEPSVPNSASTNCVTWSTGLFIMSQISWKFTQPTFFEPTRTTCGGFSVYFLAAPRDGFL